MYIYIYLLYYILLDFFVGDQSACFAGDNCLFSVGQTPLFCLNHQSVFLVKTVPPSFFASPGDSVGKRPKNRNSLSQTLLATTPFELYIYITFFKESYHDD